MFSQYFGNYLLTQGLITLDQLKNVMNIQKSVHVKIGILAVNSGIMTATQVEEIHSLQSSQDKRFGELAIERGYITGAALEKILSEQKNAHLQLGQALMDKGYLSLQEIEAALNNYKRDNDLSDVKFKAIQNDDIEEIVDTFVDLKGFSNGAVYKEYISLFTRNIIRFIDDDFSLKGFKIKDKYSANEMMIQNITGEINLSTGIDANKETFLKFASKYAGEEIPEMDELAIESFGEFLNLHNGIFTVNKSNQGIELEITPLKLLESLDVPIRNEAIGVTFFLPMGELNLIINSK